MDKKSNIRLALVLILGITLTWWGCSTRKNTFVSRQYHNLTSRDNGYFNAREGVKEAVAQMEKNHVDDFTQILNIYVDVDEGQGQTVASEMDKAIKKCSAVIQRHSIMVKNKEYCAWVDDSYFLIGRAQFYKQEFRTALETFEYVAKQYSEEEIKFDALLWMVRCYTELGMYDDGLRIIDMIKNEKGFPKKKKGAFETVYADYYMQQKEYPTAAVHLQKAIALTKRRKTRVRLMYIMAQLLQRDKEYRKAGNMYQQVVKMNPPYDMAFHAKINMARTVGIERDKASASARGGIRKQLEKMLRDDKNIDYFDQIHYALAELSHKEGDEPDALSHLEQSIRTSTNNPTQKGQSYLMVADIRFSQRKYEIAQAYYDSAVAQLPPQYEGYEAALNKKTSLTGLVSSIATIEAEDSLQRIADMDDAARDAFIDDLIEQAVKDEERKKQEKEDRERRTRELLTQNAINQRKGNPNASGGGKWYFYNPTTLASGKAEFRTRWGDRPLEDYWRRSNKSGFGDFSSGSESSDTLQASQKRDLSIGNIRDKKAYLKNIPLTSEARKASDDRIIEAYYQLGIIYKERLQDPDEAIRAFEELNRRYPSNRYRAAACYYLYLIMNDAGNTAAAETNKNIILNDYPDSEYAKLIQNPDYGKAQKVDQEEARKLYEDTYKAYLNSKYEAVMANCDLADSLHKGNPFMPKFSFLYAMSIGKTRGNHDSLFVASLEHVASQYSYDPAGTRAKEILDLMKPKKTTDTLTTKPDSASPASVFKMDMNEVHFFVYVLSGKNNIITKFKEYVSDFNQSQFGLRTFNVSSILLDDARQMVLVKSFDNGKDGMDYFKSVQAHADMFGDDKLKSVKYFTISSINYITIYKQKNIDEYVKFFQENYSN
ncbi:MAG: tetratricopeptide repeat protein [Flavobacteriales bacterium]|nr:tetratricopeptide repeat protein [Flavobacteriales bacterium]MCB9449561.1 tetratricopeptide repeat protein [Flavobacteriales bacterium]